MASIGRLQAFSFCATCANVRAVIGGVITYTRDSTRIIGRCAGCNSPVTIAGRRQPGPRIGNDKRHLN